MQFPFEIGSWLVLVPVALALVILALTGNRQPSAAKASNQQVPEDPDKRRRPGRLARWRARRGVRHGFGRWTLGFANPIQPETVSPADLRHHTLVCGATGSGKTSALQLLVDAFAEQLPMVIVDCKASAGLVDHIRALPNGV